MKKTQAGYSLIEIIMATTIFSYIVALACGTLSTSNNILVTTICQSGLNNQATHILTRITKDLQNTPEDQIIPYTFYDVCSIKFKKVDDIDEDGNIILSNTIEWCFKSAPGELENTIDDNGNGLIDEGSIIRIEYDEDENIKHKTIFSNYIMKYDTKHNCKGISFTREKTSRKISIKISLERVDPKGQIDPVTKQRKTIQFHLNTIINLGKS